MSFSVHFSFINFLNRSLLLLLLLLSITLGIPTASVYAFLFWFYFIPAFNYFFGSLVYFSFISSVSLFLYISMVECFRIDSKLNFSSVILYKRYFDVIFICILTKASLCSLLTSDKFWVRMSTICVGWIFLFVIMKSIVDKSLLNFANYLFSTL